MVFSDLTDKKQNIIQQIIQNGVYAPAVSDSRDCQYPVYGKSVLQSVKTVVAMGTHSGCLIKIMEYYNIFLSNVTRFSHKISTELLLFQIGRPYACIWFQNLAKLHFLLLQAWHFDSQNAEQRSFHSLGPS